ncbi:LOW QUALITY PROTEIN: phosphoribosyl-AMP cyclohydrolase [Geomicrobium sp. JCM 19037]|nr:LOW QUALITY PROTEIN: phosphoribosyl-AMP cyclohydrolase [Geomicrobium sp. JCM 19037]
MNIADLRWGEDGLIPVVVQDELTKDVLTLAYMSEESLKKTLDTKETWFWSRSRQELWHKGRTSGNVQSVRDVRYDCDADSLVVLVSPSGPACHTGSYSCFNDSLVFDEPSTTNDFSILRELQQTIKERQETRPEGSYTTYLFDEGVDKILKKVGEEAAEIIIAAKNRDAKELRWESADFLFHWLVLLEEQGVKVEEILETLKERHK